VATDPRLTQRIISTQEEHDAAWVGGPPPSNPVVVVDSDPEWPALYTREARRIRSVLGDRVLYLEHVGSTAVPGLAAKSIIDIDLIVADSADEDAYLTDLVAAGYRLVIREPNWHEHRAFKGPDTNINLHVFSPGNPETIRHKVFRDWLRTHADDRERYGAVKRHLASRAIFIQEYAQAKDPIIDDIYAKAFAEYAGG
jgi:GrpB-like predicted nucleotidyltransferase (UPF0157 family)